MENKGKGIAVGLLVLAALGGLAALNLSKMQFSPQVRSTVAIVESDAGVAAALGSPVSVDLWAKRTTLKRYTLATRNTEVIALQAAVKGAKGDGELEMSVTRPEGGEWSGIYEVRDTSAEGRSLVRGSFSPEGEALPPQQGQSQ